MNDEHESRNTTWGIVAGVGFSVMLMFYAVSTGAMQGGTGAGSCSSCRNAGNLPQSFSGTGSLPNTNK